VRVETRSLLVIVEGLWGFVLRLLCVLSLSISLSLSLSGALEIDGMGFGWARPVRA